MRLSAHYKDIKDGFESRPVRTTKLNKDNNSGTFAINILQAVSEQVSLHHQLGFTMADSIKHHPYREATLIIPNKNSKDQAWMIKYYAWSVAHNKMVMFRKSYNLNEEKNLSKRKAKAEHIIKSINEALKQGKVYDPEKIAALKADKALSSGSVINTHLAIDAFIQSRKKRRERTFLTYESHLKIFTEWLRRHKLLEAPLPAINTEIVEKFLNEILRSGKSSRTHNNYHNSISAFFNYYLKKRRNPIIRENPCLYIEKLKTRNGTHIAYTAEQQKQILEYCAEQQPNYWTASNFMFYLLARSNEISLMKIGDIDIKNSKIYLRSEDSKNWDERWITIPEQLKKIIIQKKLLSHPAQYYIFSKNGLNPGLQKADARRMGSYYRERVLNKLKFIKGYTFYSWKHTGVISAYRAGISPQAIRRQTGHRSWVSFEKYLNSLGLFENTEVLKNYPSLPE